MGTPIQPADRSELVALAKRVAALEAARTKEGTPPAAPAQPVPDELVEAARRAERFASAIAQGGRDEGDCYPASYIHRELRAALALPRKTEADIRAEYLDELIKFFCTKSQEQDQTDANGRALALSFVNAAQCLRSHTPYRERKTDMGDAPVTDDGWKPIDTAPRNCDLIELCAMGPDGPEHSAVMRWSPTVRNGIFPGEQGFLVAPSGAFTWRPGENGPTHWRPYMNSQDKAD